MTVYDDFVNENKGKPVYIPGYATAECVALFWKWNSEHGGEQYSAPGAAQLWEQPPGLPYLWDNYERHDPSTPRQDGDWCIWSGTAGPYPNGGSGHIAMSYHGQFFSQNPNPPQVMNLNTNGMIGILRPKPSILPQESTVTPIMGNSPADDYIQSPQFKIDIFTGGKPGSDEANARESFIAAIADKILDTPIKRQGVDPKNYGSEYTSLRAIVAWFDASRDGTTATIHQITGK